MRTFALCAALGLVVGCGHHGSGDDAGGDDASATGDGGHGAALCQAGLQSIDLSPASSTVQLDGSATAPTVAFDAMGHFSDGHSASIDPADLDWVPTRGDDTDPGAAAAGVFTPFPYAGGTVTITASASLNGSACATGTATVDLVLNATIGTGDPTDWGGTPVTTGAPTIVYPSDQTRFPRNIYRTLFQWRTTGFTEFRLIFTGASSTVTVYSDGVHDLCLNKSPAAGCWEADETAWNYIAGSNAGATATWTVDALDRSTVPPTVRRAGPISIAFSRKDVKGAIFYWSTTAAGVRRASVSAAEPEDYIAANTIYTNPTDKVKCVACHVVSRDGQYLAGAVSADSGNSMWITQVTDMAPPTPLVKAIAGTGGHGFETISPDDQYVVASWNGPMWQLTRVDGMNRVDLPIVGDATQPDWSPDNSQVVYATAKGDAPANASLAVIPYLGGTSWGTPQVIVTHPAQKSLLFPQFSPTGDYLAYSQGKGGHDDLTAQLFVTGKDGTTPAPIELLAANRIVSNATTTGQFENSQPTWAPQDPDDDYLWVAFNSERAYGVVAPAGKQQIWVAAIDPAALAAGTVDPSFPAFRLQFQGLAENNHRAYWTADIRDLPPPPPDVDGGVCIADGDTCIPGVDSCCDALDVCDTMDNGQTYSCFQPPIP